MYQFTHSPIVYSTQKPISNLIKLFYKYWDEAKTNNCDDAYVNKCFCDLCDRCEKENLSVLYVIEELNHIL